MAQRTAPQHQAQDIGFWEVLAFVCELAMLVALAVAGWALGTSAPWRVVAAVVAPGPVAVVWALWLAPTAGRRLTGVPLLLAKAAIFVLAGATLAWAGHSWWGIVLSAVALIDLVMLHRRENRRPAGVTEAG